MESAAANRSTASKFVVLVWAANASVEHCDVFDGIEVRCLSHSMESLINLCKASNHFDVLLIEISADDSSGIFESFSKIRKSCPDVDVIIMSKDVGSPQILRFLESGARDFFELPLSAESVKRKLEPLKHRREVENRLFRRLPCGHVIERRWLQCFTASFSKCLSPTNFLEVREKHLDDRPGPHSCDECERELDAALLKIEMQSLNSRLTVLKQMNMQMQNLRNIQKATVKDGDEEDIFQMIISASGEDAETAAWIESEFVGGTRGPASCACSRRRSVETNDIAAVPEAEILPSCISADLDVHVDGPSNCVERIQELGLDKWDVDIFHLSDEHLLEVAALLLEDRGVLRVLRTTRRKLERFLDSLRRRYHHENPYHNFRHAVDVLRCLYIFFTQGAASDLFLAEDIVATMIAAIAHDVGHPGRNNPFLINTRNDLARIYNDRSVLENHHAATLYEILQDPDCDIFSELDDDEWNNIRRTVTSAILATDMAHHIEMMSRLAEFSTKGGYRSEDKLHRQTLLEALLHAADISNPIKPWEFSKVWSGKVMDEFLAQGDAEKALGMPVTPFMDRTTASEARNTLNFIDFAASPLFALLKDLLPALGPCYDTLLSNRQRWVQVLEEQDASGDKLNMNMAKHLERRRSIMDRTLCARSFSSKSSQDISLHASQASLSASGSMSSMGYLSLNPMFPMRLQPRTLSGIESYVTQHPAIAKRCASGTLAVRSRSLGSEMDQVVTVSEIPEPNS